MAAYHFAAIRASPLLPLLFKESIDTFVSDVFQVFDHAQVVFGSVTPVEGLESAAGEVPAFTTEPDKSLSNKVAMLFHESTVLTAWQATGAVSPLEPFPVKVVS
jgi:hypothetical protein